MLGNTFDDKHVIAPSRSLRAALYLVAAAQEHIVKYEEFLSKINQIMFTCLPK